jgi:hypothetical protein
MVMLLNPLVARARCDHAAIRARTNALAVHVAPDPIIPHELGVLVAGHVRFEEHELLPARRARASRRTADLVAAALGPCRPPFEEQEVGVWGVRHRAIGSPGPQLPAPSGSPRRCRS